MKRLIRLLLRLSRHLTYRLLKLQQRFDIEPVPANEQRKQVVRSTRHDMVADPDEPYYCEQYWYWIEKILDSVALPSSAVCMDLGCGQGRLTVPLARKFECGTVIGIDFSPEAINRARQYAGELGIRNIDYRVGDIHQVVRAWPGVSVHVILMTEVTFFYPRWRDDIAELQRILVPGGILGIAFRPQYYDALQLIKNRMWEQLDLLLNSRSGPLYGDTADFTWQKSAEVAALFTGEMEMDLMELIGIGCCSGIEHDPHASIARPAKLDQDEKERLMRLEVVLGQEIPDAGRYMLAIARKKTNSMAGTTARGVN